MFSFHEIAEAIPIIVSLIIIEGLLSVDNALAIAAMASHLPGKQKQRALRWGIVGAYVFRGVALALVTYIVKYAWLKILGAAYLIHLMASHFAERAEREKEAEAEEGAELVRKVAGRGFWATVVAIEVMDLSLSVDNVVAAVAMSSKLWVVCTGVFIGILALRFVAGWCIKLIERFPILEPTAFVLIGFVGAILVVEVASVLMGHPVAIHSWEKFVGIVGILGIALWYEESPKVKATLKPVFRVARMPLLAYAAVSNVVFGAVAYPFKALARVIVGKKGEKKEVREEETVGVGRK